LARRHDDWIDLLADQSPQGLEVVRGRLDLHDCTENWKLQAENGVDGYHVSTVHRVSRPRSPTARRRARSEGLRETESGRMTGDVASACYDFGTDISVSGRSAPSPRRIRCGARRSAWTRVLEERVDWMLNRGRNLYLFPNAFVMTIRRRRSARSIRSRRRVRSSRCAASRGRRSGGRARRAAAQVRDFYLTTGMATSDDLAALEAAHAGSRGGGARWNDFARGMRAMRAGRRHRRRRDRPYSQTMTPNWDHETLYHGFYRFWKERLLESGIV